MNKHISGPWGFRERNPPRKIALTRKHWEVGQMSPPNFGCAIVFGDTDADARLISAAPDLLEALMQIVAHDKAMIACKLLRPFVELERAEAAIVKATGSAE
jgi:hypothetical protein